MQVASLVSRCENPDQAFVPLIGTPQRLTPRSRASRALAAPGHHDHHRAGSPGSAKADHETASLQPNGPPNPISVTSMPQTYGYEVLQRGRRSSMLAGVQSGGALLSDAPRRLFA